MSGEDDGSVDRSDNDDGKARSLGVGITWSFRARFAFS